MLGTLRGIEFIDGMYSSRDLENRFLIHDCKLPFQISPCNALDNIISLCQNLLDFYVYFVEMKFLKGNNSKESSFFFAVIVNTINDTILPKFYLSKRCIITTMLHS